MRPKNSLALVVAIGLIAAVGLFLAVSLTGHDGKSAARGSVATDNAAKLAQAEDFLKNATVTYSTWLKYVRQGRYIPADGSATNWGRALTLIEDVRTSLQTTTTTATTSTTTPATTTTPTTTTTPSGAIIFRGDFEQCRFTDPPWYTPAILGSSPGGAVDGTYNIGMDYIERSVVGSGSCSARIDLEADTSRSSRADIVREPRIQGAPGMDIYYSDEFLLPATDPAPQTATRGGRWQRPTSWGYALIQVGNFPSIWGAALSLVFKNDGALYTAVQTGPCVDPTGCQFSNGGGSGQAFGGMPVAPQAISAANLTLGVWHQVILHQKMAKDSSGVIEVWWRKRGVTAWQKVTDIRGFPTVQWFGSNEPGWVTEQLLDGYRGGANFDVTIYHDNHCVATTFAAAESCLS